MARRINQVCENWERQKRLIVFLRYDNIDTDQVISICQSNKIRGTDLYFKLRITAYVLVSLQLNPDFSVIDIVVDRFVIRNRAELPRVCSIQDAFFNLYNFKIQKGFCPRRT